MMANTAALTVRIVSEAAGNGFAQTETRIGRLGNVAKAGIAAVSTAAVGAGALMVSAVQDAANLEQSVGAIDTVFGSSSKMMHAWAGSAATDVGLTKNEFNELGTLIGSQLKNGGTAMDQLAPKTRNLIATGADLASMFGGTTKDAVSALSSALKGERDPIERYGVTLNQAKIDAEAAALGFTKVGGALSAEASQAATLSLIMKQTKDAHGNFGRESNTLAHQQQVFTAELNNAKTALGTALLPIMTRAFRFLNTTGIPAVKQITAAFSTWFATIGSGGDIAGRLDLDSLMPVLVAVGNALKLVATVAADVVVNGVLPLQRAVAGALLPILRVAATTVIPALVAAWRQIGPPLRDVLAAVGGLVAAIGARLLPVFRILMPVVRATIGNLAGIIGPALRVIAGIIRTVTAIIRGDWSGAWAAIRSTVSAAWDLIRGIVRGSVNMVRAVITAAWAAIRGLTTAAWTGIRNAVTDGVTRIVSAVRDLGRRAVSALRGFAGDMAGVGRDMIAGLIGGIRDMADRAASAASDVVKGAIGSAKSALGISSPSKVFRQIGADTGDGMVVGLRDQARAVQAAAADLIGTPAAIAASSPVQVLAPSQGSSRTPTQITINFNGVVTDKQGTAREIESLLRNYGILTGGAGA